MKKTLYVLFAVIGLMHTGCQNDPLEDIEEGNWNNERNVLEIKLEFKMKGGLKILANSTLSSSLNTQRICGKLFRCDAPVWKSMM